MKTFNILINSFLSKNHCLGRQDFFFSVRIKFYWFQQRLKYYIWGVSQNTLEAGEDIGEICWFWYRCPGETQKFGNFLKKGFCFLHLLIWASIWLSSYNTTIIVIIIQHNNNNYHHTTQLHVLTLRRTTRQTQTQILWQFNNNHHTTKQ